MALIPIYHVVADQLPIDASNTGRSIIAGQVVKLAGDGSVMACDTAGEVYYGIAGDTQADTPPANANNLYTAYQASLNIGANGATTRWTQNRVSDMFDETAASGLLTVFTSGGKFATDQYAAARAAHLNPNTAVYTDATGLLTDVAGAGNMVGIITEGPSAYPSGVPGVDTADNSLSLGTFVTFRLWH